VTISVVELNNSSDSTQRILYSAGIPIADLMRFAYGCSGATRCKGRPGTLFGRFGKGGGIAGKEGLEAPACSPPVEGIPRPVGLNKDLGQERALKQIFEVSAYDSGASERFERRL
jgi:hypothetical protein